MRPLAPGFATSRPAPRPRSQSDWGQTTGRQQFLTANELTDRRLEETVKRKAKLMDRQRPRITWLEPRTQGVLRSPP